MQAMPPRPPGPPGMMAGPPRPGQQQPGYPQQPGMANGFNQQRPMGPPQMKPGGMPPMRPGGPPQPYAQGPGGPPAGPPGGPPGGPPRQNGQPMPPMNGNSGGFPPQPPTSSNGPMAGGPPRPGMPPGPPRPGMAPGPSMGPPGPGAGPSGPAAAPAGPPRPGFMPARPGMPQSRPGMAPPPGPGMAPPPGPGMAPPPGPGMAPPPGPGMAPPPGPGMAPPPGPGMAPPPGPGMAPPPGPGMAPPPGPGMAPPPGPGMGPRPGMQPGMPGMGPPMSQASGMPPPPGPGMPPMQGMGGPGMGPPRPGMPPGPGMGGPPQPGQMYPQTHQPQPGMGPGAPRRSLDPDQMPSPITVMEDDQRNNGGDFNTNEKGLTPPLVTTNFTVKDYGNASPRYIRSTMYYVPATEDMRKQTGVPFGLVISPMARIQADEIEPPITDFGPEGPVRCGRCKAYMCPLMQFTDGGRKFQCVFCKALTEVPANYFQHLDHTGKRIDVFQRPELCLGTYECLATKDYCRDSKEPSPPAVIFAIDVSYPMVKEGVVDLLCKNMKAMLRNLPRDTNCDKSVMKVGFMTYDSKINFYNINSKLAQPQQMTVGDVGDMFVPLSEGFFVSPDESEAVIDALMEQIPLMFNETKETETILGPVIQAGKEAFKAADCTGKLIIFHHNLPIAEAPGKLRSRDDRKILGSEKEKTVLMPQTKEYNGLGQDCVSVGCSVDLFLFNNAYIDVATLSQVSRLTGGQVYKYTYFNKDIDAERMLNDLRNNLSRPVAFDAIMRVRTSTGIRPCEFYGSFYMNNTTDTELASVNSDMAVACEIKYDDKLTEEDGVYIQVALLFTSCGGQRRLRIINLALSTGTAMADMYRNCELDTVMNFTAKQSISRIMENNPKQVKESLISNCAAILACYRKNCASPSSAGQLILPECMKLLPLYTNCLLKSDVLSGGADVGCDERAFLMNAVSSMDILSTVVYFYPRLLPLHEMHTSDVTPNPIRCSIDKIRDDGVYLLENGLYMFLYIGLAADPDFIQKLFGVSTPAQINVEAPTLEAFDNPISERVRRVIDTVRSERPRQYLRLVLVRQRDKMDILVRHYLCEDRSGPGQTGSNSDMNFSYVDFLCHMHKEIRALLG